MQAPLVGPATTQGLLCNTVSHSWPLLAGRDSIVFPLPELLQRRLAGAVSAVMQCPCPSRAMGQHLQCWEVQCHQVWQLARVLFTGASATSLTMHHNPLQDSKHVAGHLFCLSHHDISCSSMLAMSGVSDLCFKVCGYAQHTTIFLIPGTACTLAKPRSCAQCMSPRLIFYCSD